MGQLCPFVMVAKYSVVAICLCLCTTLLLPVSSVSAAAEEYRQCTVNDSCQIGEFLYDDDYQPITTATCSLTIHDPSNAVFLNAQPMSSQSDGWYSHTFSTTGASLGLYRSTMCCTHQTEYLCTDKTFEVTTSPSGITASEVTAAVWDTTRASHATTGTFGENLQNPSSVSAADIWAYPNRSLSSFGTLVADIWAYSARSLNDVGSLVSSIWSRDDRTLTSSNLSSGSLATKSDVTSIDTTTDATSEINTKVDAISAELSTQTYLLEKLVNAPILETLIEDTTPEPQDLSAKISQTKEVAAQLAQGTNQLQKQLAAVTSDWETTSYQLALTELGTSTQVLGISTEVPDPEQTSINAQISWLQQQWNSPIITELSTQATAAVTTTNTISKEIRTYGKTPISQEYLGITTQHVTKLNTLVGRADESIASTDTLYGFIADLEYKNDSIAELNIQLQDIFDKWDTYPAAVRSARLATIKQQLLKINVIPNIEPILDKRRDGIHAQQNLALALKGILDSNYAVLTQEADQTLTSTWLEKGSIVFRSLVTNPSSAITQTVPVKYVRPQEIKAEHILRKDDWITISYNQEKNALVAEGEVSLQPNETKTFIVEVVDVLNVSEEEIQ